MVYLSLLRLNGILRRGQDIESRSVRVPWAHPLEVRNYQGATLHDLWTVGSNDISVSLAGTIPLSASTTLSVAAADDPEPAPDPGPDPGEGSDTPAGPDAGQEPGGGSEEDSTTVPDVHLPTDPSEETRPAQPARTSGSNVRRVYPDCDAPDGALDTPRHPAIGAIMDRDFDVVPPRGFAGFMLGAVALLALVPIGFALADELPVVGAVAFALILAPFCLPPFGRGASRSRCAKGS